MCLRDNCDRKLRNSAFAPDPGERRKTEQVEDIGWFMAATDKVAAQKSTLIARSLRRLREHAARQNETAAPRGRLFQAPDADLNRRPMTNAAVGGAYCAAVASGSCAGSAAVAFCSRSAISV